MYTSTDYDDVKKWEYNKNKNEEIMTTFSHVHNRHRKSFMCNFMRIFLTTQGLSPLQLLRNYNFLPLFSYLLQICCLATTFAQYGPAPPRLNIPGAIGVPGPGRPAPVQQFRRPNRPQPSLTEARFLQEGSKPVNEEDEDDYPHHQVQAAPPRALFTSEPQDHEPPQRVERPKQAQRNFPAQQPQQHQQQHQQQQPARPRAQQNFHEDRQRPHQSEDKPKKPVAQILRKYREENPNGSITWGFENDDGSYKEETIGIDCITRGVYGYIDPDGEKRVC